MVEGTSGGGDQWWRGPVVEGTSTSGGGDQWGGPVGEGQG